MSVDIVVPTRNRPDDLARLVRSVAGLDYPAFRLIVVDQSDDPETGARIVRAAERSEFSHVVHRGRGKSVALNDVLPTCTAELIAFTDDDCEVPTDWLSIASQQFLFGPGPAIVFGNVVACPHDPTEQFVPAIEFDSTRSIDGPIWRSHGLVGMGANMVVRRRVLADLGDFDVDLGPGGPLRTGEDCELTYRALQRGQSVVQAHDLTVVHHGARPVAGRVASELINDGFYAVAAGYGKHLRRGDARTWVVVSHELLWILALMGRAVVTRTRPAHLRRLMRFGKGLFDGFRAGPSWRTEVGDGTARASA